MAQLDLKIDLGTPDPTTNPTSSMLSNLRSKLVGKTTAYKSIGKSEFSIDKLFVILRDFLQPDTTLSLESTVQSVLALLPENAPLSQEVYAFGETCVDLAQQIPYHHPSQLKLARFIERIGRSTKVYEVHDSKGRVSISRYQRLGETLRDNLDGPQRENPSQWANYSAFLAHLSQYRIFPTDPTYQIWEMRDAFEQRHDEVRIREAHVLAAAQWILWDGQGLFTQLLFLGDVAPRDLQKWTPGPLYTGQSLLSISRWRFWRDGFNDVAREGVISEECRNVARKAADMMDSLERNMTF